MLYKIHLCLFFVFSLIGYSQTKETYKILSSVDSLGVEFAHIVLNDEILTYTDQNGEFQLDSNIVVDSLKISHLSYFSRIIMHTELQEKRIFYLSERLWSLDEVIVNVKQEEKPKEILPERSSIDVLFNRDDISFPYSYEFAVFVPNYEKEKLLINKIILKSKRRESNGDDKYIPFRVNLMTIDSVTNLPDVKIFEEDLTVGKLENQHLLLIDLKGYEEVFMPKNGICVVVSLYSEEYYLKNGFTERPAFGVVQINNKSQFREYRKHVSADKKSWREAGYSKSREQCFNFGVEVVRID